jgi:rSAM/selenodomain-associated transferase 2
MTTLSVVVPMLNESTTIARTLVALRRGAPHAEIVVVDGGSADLSVDIAKPLCDKVIASPRGRARQMNAGARESIGDVLAFVHADTIVPPTFADDIDAALSHREIVGGRFDVQLDSEALALRLIGALISIRSRISRTGTGDQAIFVRRSIFDRIGGFPDLDVCEDLDFARRMKRAGPVACLRSRVD